MAGFSGSVDVTWLTQPGDDRDMQLNKDFTFTDAAGLTWTAKKGAKINGASIPAIFWKTFGTPFVGDYRRASVVHDYYCDVRTRPSDATHKMFYEACVAGGVSQTKAKGMYLLVKSFGPSWQVASSNLEMAGKIMVRKGQRMTYTNAMPHEEVSKMMRWIETENPSIEEIDAAIKQNSTPTAIVPIPQG